MCTWLWGSCWNAGSNLVFSAFLISSQVMPILPAPGPHSTRQGAGLLRAVFGSVTTQPAQSLRSCSRESGRELSVQKSNWQSLARFFTKIKPVSYNSIVIFRALFKKFSTQWKPQSKNAFLGGYKQQLLLTSTCNGCEHCVPTKGSPFNLLVVFWFPKS